MTTIVHKTADLNGVRIHYADAGAGPLVLLCHGFPECWYSWRAQIEALAAAGYRVVAPDQRGYGQSSTPDPIDAYDLCHLTSDMVALVRSLDAGPAAIVGHDWGAVVTFTAALLRPDLFTSVALISVPYLSRLWGGPRPTDGMRRMCGDDGMFYQLYFQEPGIAEMEFDANPREFLSRIFFVASGDAVKAQRPARMLFKRGERFIDALPRVDSLPSWLSRDDLDYFTDQFTHSGFRGPVNWYRNIDRNAENLAFLAGRLVEQPSLFIAGEYDGVIRMYPADYEMLAETMPGLTRKVIVQGAGHWVQQESPAEVNTALLEFLRTVQPA